MKKSKILSTFFVLILLVSICNVPVAQAETKVKYNYVKVNKNKTYYGKTTAKAKVYFEKVVLKGNSKAIRKINKAINEECNKFFKNSDYESVYRIAEYYAKNGYYNYDKITFKCYAESKVTYNTKGVISIRISTHWWADGVSNTNRYGLTFKLKTGKHLTLTDVCEQNSKTIKNNLIKKIKNYSPAADTSIVNETNIEKMNFYLKPNNKAMVCFGPYELGLGGQYKEFSVKSKYK